MFNINVQPKDGDMGGSMYAPSAPLEEKLRQVTEKQKVRAPIELMTLRAESAEKALEDCNRSLESLRISYENNCKIIQSTKEIVRVLHEEIKNNTRDAYIEHLALEGLKEIIEKNRISLEKSALDYEKIQAIAFLDDLTGLPNRRLLDDRLHQIIINNKRWSSYSAAIFVDLDKFKDVNDIYGHYTGDELLISVADRLKSCIRESDTVARYGGDEFVVLLDKLDGNLENAEHQANIVACKILKYLIIPYTLHTKGLNKVIREFEYQNYASLGIAMFDGVISDKDGILDRADKAMYQAKCDGGKTIRFAALPEKLAGT